MGVQPPRAEGFWWTIRPCHGFLIRLYDGLGDSQKKRPMVATMSRFGVETMKFAVPAGSGGISPLHRLENCIYPEASRETQDQL